MDLYVTINHKQKDSSGIMLITKKMFYLYPDLRAFLKATEPTVIQQGLRELRNRYTFHHEHADSSITRKSFSLPEIIASQGLVTHAKAELETITEEATVSTTLINMLHCAIEHQQPEMIDFCINHIHFKKAFIVSKTLLLTAHDGPRLLFEQLFEQIYPELPNKAPDILVLLAYEAISGGQHAILKQLFTYDPLLIHRIWGRLYVTCNTFSIGPLNETFKAHHTDMVRFLFECEPMKTLLPRIGLYTLNHAVQNKHTDAVDLLLSFDAIQEHLNKPPRCYQNNTLLLAAYAGDAYIFERLLTIEHLKQNLLTDTPYTNAFRGEVQQTNAWTTAISAGHVAIARIIFDKVSEAEKETLKQDTSVLSRAIDLEDSRNPAMLQYLFTFEAIQNEFNQKFFYYMQMICCIVTLQIDFRMMQRLKENTIPLFNFLLDTPIIRQKMREDNRALHKLVSEFVTLQIAMLKRVQTNAPPLSLDRYCHFIDMLQKTKWYREGSAEDIAYLTDLPRTPCDDSGVTNPRIKCLLPWMQYQTPRTEHRLPTQTLHFLDAQKNKRKHEDATSDDESAASENSCSSI
jgi:hypothetical protein